MLIHTPDRQVLLIRRADAGEHWQSVTGSKDHADESWLDTAVREVMEETGIDALAPGHRLLDWGWRMSMTSGPSGSIATHLVCSATVSAYSV